VVDGYDGGCCLTDGEEEESVIPCDRVCCDQKYTKKGGDELGTRARFFFGGFTVT